MKAVPRSSEQWGRWIDETAALLDLSLDPSHRAGVIANLQRLAELAASLEDPALDVVDESAAVFRP